MFTASLQLTQSLHNQRTNIRSNKHPRIPPLPHPRHPFRARTPYSPAKHHIHRRREKQRADEQQRALDDERGPRGVVEVASYARAEAGDFT